MIVVPVIVSVVAAAVGASLVAHAERKYAGITANQESWRPRLRAWTIDVTLIILSGQGLFVLAPLGVWGCVATTFIAVGCYGSLRLDLRFHVIPDRFQIAGALGGAGWLLSQVARPSPAHIAIECLLGLAFPLGLWACGSIYERVRGIAGMGMGDLKVLAWTGVILGRDNWLVIALAVGAAAVILVIHRLTRGPYRATEPFAFAPYLILGFVGAVASRYLTVG